MFKGESQPKNRLTKFLSTKKGSTHSWIEPKGQKLKIKELIDIKNTVFPENSKSIKTICNFFR